LKDHQPERFGHFATAGSFSAAAFAFRSGLPFVITASRMAAQSRMVVPLSFLAALTRSELDAIGKSLDEKLDRVIANLDHRVKA
jgi:hypothetical protein